MPRPAPDHAALDATARQLTDREFELLSALVLSQTGIALGPSKRALLQARLGKRLKALGLSKFLDYHRLLEQQGPEGEELGRFVDAVTTNKTEFFREPHHFAYLRDRLVPALEARVALGAERRVRVWSAGCSSGEEPYTIAIALADALGDEHRWDLKILASDISTDMLRRAETGTYSLDEVAAVPRMTLRRYFLRGTGANDGRVRVRPELRGLVAFRRINLLDAAWPIRTTFDVVFCRNVLIYFDRATQQRVLERLISFVNDGGLLMLGHSEGVYGMVAGLQHVGNTVYRKESPPCRQPS